jgi:hypothetical protein
LGAVRRIVRRLNHQKASSGQGQPERQSEFLHFFSSPFEFRGPARTLQESPGVVQFAFYSNKKIPGLELGRMSCYGPSSHTRIAARDHSPRHFVSLMFLLEIIGGLLRRSTVGFVSVLREQWRFSQSFGRWGSVSVKVGWPLALSGLAHFVGNDQAGCIVYIGNKAAGLRAATLSPTNQPRTETP